MKHIRTSREFADVLKNGDKWRGQTIVLYAKTTEAQEEIKIGTIVAKRCEPLATRRNYVKRRIYSFFREQGDKWKQGQKVVIRLDRHTSKETRKTLSKEISEELEQLSQKAGIRKK